MTRTDQVRTLTYPPRTGERQTRRRGPRKPQDRRRSQNLKRRRSKTPAYSEQLWDNTKKLAWEAAHALEFVAEGAVQEAAGWVDAGLNLLFPTPRKRRG